MTGTTLVVDGGISLGQIRGSDVEGVARRAEPASAIASPATSKMLSRPK